MFTCAGLFGGFQRVRLQRGTWLRLGDYKRLDSLAIDALMGAEQTIIDVDDVTLGSGQVLVANLQTGVTWWGDVGARCGVPPMLRNLPAGRARECSRPQRYARGEGFWQPARLYLGTHSRTCSCTSSPRLTKRGLRIAILAARAWSAAVHWPRRACADIGRRSASPESASSIPSPSTLGRAAHIPGSPSPCTPLGLRRIRTWA